MILRMPGADVAETPVFLSTVAPGRHDRRVALTVVLVSATIFLATAPLAKVRLLPVGAFIPIYETALVINDLVTTVLLLGQYRFTRSRALLALAGAYLFTASITIAHALTFPGLFAPTGLLGAGPHSTAWLYMFWHAGFPILVVAYALLKEAAPTPAPEPAAPPPPGGVRGPVLATVAATLAVVVGFTLLATAGHDALPALMRGNNYTPAQFTVITSTWVLSFVALATLWWRRPHSKLDLWLMVVMCAWVFDIALSGVLNAARFDLGFYAGRIYGLVAASFVLVVLLIENGALYARLVEAHVGERRGRAEADVANRAKSEFLSRMSHELRTPLNAILGFGQLIEMRATTPQDRESVEQILKGGRHLLNLINEVLDISRIEAGGLSLSLEPVNVGEVIRRVVDLTRPLASPRRIALHTKGSASDRYVLADHQRLQQVLLNLVSNGIKYNREEGQVTVACRADGPGRLRISVSDTGSGIPAASQSRLFTPFDRLGVEAHGIEGTGLGLALSRRLVEAMGGLIGLESVEGQGSMFWVDLPEARSPVALPGVNRYPVPDSPTSLQRSTVLYVEDNPSSLRLVERLLADRPTIRLIPAMQGRLALALAREHRPDVILSDLHLPDISGEEVLREIQADPQLKDTPIIILSADATPGQVTRLLAAGARAYLTKPIDVAELLSLLDATLSD
jgi:signal transduction histidine kinase/CheY-like chemotaxis protein